MKELSKSLSSGKVEDKQYRPLYSSLT